MTKHDDERDTSDDRTNATPGGTGTTGTGRRFAPRGRVLAVVLVGLLVALAGCTGGPGGLGDLGDDGQAEADTPSDGDSVGGPSDPYEEENWFNLSKPGIYEFELKQLNEETGELESGTVTYEVTAVEGNTSTLSVDYQLGGDSLSSSITGSEDDLFGRMLFNEAFVPVWTLSFAPFQYYAQFGFTDVQVGNKKTQTTDGSTTVVEVTEETSYAGVECKRVVSTLDGTKTLDTCVTGGEGTAPYYAEYDEETGELVTEIKLVNFERR